MLRLSLQNVSLAFVFLALGSCGGERDSVVTPKGEDTSVKTDVLKAGAAAMQRHAPVEA